MELTPKQSASLARDVYALTKMADRKDAVVFLNHQYNNKIGFREDNIVQAKTGGPGIIKAKTAFGFLLIGKDTLKGHAFILFRGTQYLADWLTNLNVSLARSTSGQPVHDGFNQAFHSMLPQIKSFAETLPGGTEVHCIGHSLGGGLATLTAEWISQSTSLAPRLYSFGCPRVGLIGFADECTRLLKQDRMFRVYHRTDIVPWIPVWPYFHTPTSGREYFLRSPGILPGAEWHDMGRYAQSVGSHHWDGLYAMRPPKRTDSGLEHWLKDTAVIGSTISAIEWISDAIIYVIKKCVEYGARAISVTAATSLTIMDRLAYVLHEGIDLAKEVSSWVLLLMRKIAEFLGYGRELAVADMTYTLIRNLLLNLSQKVNTIAQEALNKALASG